MFWIGISSLSAGVVSTIFFYFSNSLHMSSTRPSSASGTTPGPRSYTYYLTSDFIRIMSCTCRPVHPQLLRLIIPIVHCKLHKMQTDNNPFFDSLRTHIPDTLNINYAFTATKSFESLSSNQDYQPGIARRQLQLTHQISRKRTRALLYRISLVEIRIPETRSR